MKLVYSRSKYLVPFSAAEYEIDPPPPQMMILKETVQHIEWCWDGPPNSISAVGPLEKCYKIFFLI